MHFPGVFPLDPGLSQYSKLLLASTAQVLSMVAEEKAALQQQLSQEGDTQSFFIQIALGQLQVSNALHIVHLLRVFAACFIGFRAQMPTISTCDVSSIRGRTS